ncbi:hypothetical protein BH24ACT20_BH24ACT20_05570 [soil metagenome]|jgi:hypothetical protein
MERPLLRQLQKEVERQCGFAMIALQDIEEASANSDGKLFWYSVQGLLVAVERLSLMLWPPNPRVPERGAALRENLGVGEASPLKPRELPERFIRFDEQLEEWYESSEQRRFFDSYTEPLDVLAETKSGDRFRGYDIENNALLFHDEPYHLGPISDAVEELFRKAEEETQKPRFDLGA